jgi:hypothetical protein
VSGSRKYLSFVLRPEGTLGAGFGNGYFGLNVLCTGLSHLFVGKPGTSPEASYSLENAGGGGLYSSAVSPVVGQPVLLVIRIDFAAGNDSISLFVNLHTRPATSLSTATLAIAAPIPLL